MFLLYLAKTSCSYTTSYRPISINHEWINITKSGEMHPKCWVYHTQKNLTSFKYTTLKLQMQQTNARMLTAHDWNLTSCKLLLLWSFCLSYVCYTIIPGISWCWWVQTPANKKHWGNLLLGKSWAKTTI